MQAEEAADADVTPERAADVLPPLETEPSLPVDVDDERVVREPEDSPPEAATSPAESDPPGGPLRQVPNPLRVGDLGTGPLRDDAPGAGSHGGQGQGCCRAAVGVAGANDFRMASLGGGRPQNSLWGGRSGVGLVGW